MFDFGFWEIAIIGVITLIVVGPDKMPALARKAGLYAGKASKFINKIKKDINEEIRADELKEIKDQLTVTGKDPELSEVFKETKEGLDAIKQESIGVADIFEQNQNQSSTEKT